MKTAGVIGITCCLGMLLLQPGWSVVVTFDDLAGKAIPDNYAGVNWVDPSLGNRWIVDASHPPLNSTPCAFLNIWEAPVEATISFDEAVEFVSITFGGSWGDSVELFGHSAGGDYSSGSIALDGSSLLRVQAGWPKITSLTIYFDWLFPGSTSIDDLTYGLPLQPQLATIFSEDFESFASSDDLLNAGWEVRHGQFPAEDGGIWHPQDDVLEGGGVSGVYVISDSDAEGELPSGKYLDERLISPEIDCTHFSEVHLLFRQDVAVHSGGFPERFNVYISNDPEHEEWESDWVPFWREEDGNTAAPQSIDISQFADGEKIRIRWRYTANYDYWWAVDDVRVVGRPDVLDVTSLAVNDGTGEVSIAWDAPDGLFAIEASDSPIFWSVAELAADVTEKQWTGADPGASGNQRFYRVRMD